MSKKILSVCQNLSMNQPIQSEERFPIYILLENIRSLYNVGSIFRSADAARVQKIFLCGITGYPPRKEIAKTALGAQDTVPWEYVSNASDIIPQLRASGITVLAVEQTDEKKMLWTRPISFPVCFAFGYEVEGLLQETIDLCDDVIEIPMFGCKGSLNVAVACGIVIFDALRRCVHQCISQG
jgi:23S rRNA (guanosine2251-2'-O)-methyltransferase